jgi:hypothetical protein
MSGEVRLKFSNSITLGLIGAFAASVSAQHAVPPKRVSGTYDMTTWTPVPIGTCSGSGAGCTNVMGFDWLSDGRMVLFTTDYIGQDTKPGNRPRAKVSIVSTPVGPGATVTTIASHFKQPAGIKVVNDKIWVPDMDTMYVVTTNTPVPADTLKNRTPRFGMPLSTMYGGNLAPYNMAFNKTNCATGSGLTCDGTNSQAHHYVFTPIYYQGKFYAAYGGNTGAGNGYSNLPASSYFSGAILRWDSTTTQLDSSVNRFAGGLRSPNGTLLGPNGSLFVTDHQGSWLPMCTLTRYKIDTARMQFGGYRQEDGYTPNFAQAWYDRGQADYVPPVAINRYNQGDKTGWVAIAQPILLTQGPYKGQILVGDINSYGLWRVALDTLNDTTGKENMQGAVFYFNPGNGNEGSAALGTGKAGINRLSQGPDGTIYAGAGRGVGNWGAGPSEHLIYIFKPKANPSQFEIMNIRSLKDGYELVLNKKVDPKTVTNGSFRVGQRSWVRQKYYGMGFSPANMNGSSTSQPSGAGTPQFTNRTIDSIQVSTDSLRIRLKVSGIKRLNQDRRGDSVTHWHTVFFFGKKLLSSTGDSIYTNEADYAQNWINTTREWNGGKLTYDTVVVPIGIRQPSQLQNNVWFKQGRGFVDVNVDNMKPYAVVVRDLHGRVVDRKAGTAGVPMQIKAPGATQSVYTLEVKSEGESYSKLFTF